MNSSKTTSTILNKSVFFAIAINMLISTGVLYCQSYIQVNGRVVDSLTHKPLPYTTIRIVGTTQGIITNEKGYFQILIPDSLRNKDLNFSFMGYNSYRKSISSLKNKTNLISLSQSKFKIREVIIRQNTPEMIIKKAIRRIKDNYPDKPYASNGYYREVLKENNNYIQYLEAYLNTYNFAYLDTTQTQVKVVEAHTRDDLQSIHFMQKEVKSRYKRIEKRAKRKGEKVEDLDEATLKILFGGPHRILGTDPIRYRFQALDSNQMKKFIYTFEKDEIMDGRELYNIAFKSKRKIDYMKFSGTIYIDKESFAIVKMAMNGEFIMPFYAKPFLQAAGLSIEISNLKIDHQYTSQNDKWYLYKSMLTGDSYFAKQRIAKENEYSHFEIEHAFVSTEAKFENVKPIPKKDQLIHKSFSELLKEYNPDFWSTHNKIAIESIK
ncbi:MAG: carboxypeptidase-like regulatory domain-containing protein [Bacteroidales bacterium]|nr:carboxypeptidase-like regulatory domain-containing protein [Bacteroidales bacterium]